MSAQKWRFNGSSWRIALADSGRPARLETWQSHAWRSPPIGLRDPREDALVARVLDLECELLGERDYRRAVREAALACEEARLASEAARR